MAVYFIEQFMNISFHFQGIEVFAMYDLHNFDVILFNGVAAKFQTSFSFRATSGWNGQVIFYTIISSWRNSHRLK